MKKNMLTVIILALGVVNLILTGLLVFVALPAFNKTSKLMTQVTSMIELEKNYPDGNIPLDVTVPIEDQEPYTFPNENMQVNLKTSADGTAHYAKFSCGISMNMKNEKYEKLKATIEPNIKTLEEIITTGFNRYTKEELLTTEGMDQLKQEILEEFRVFFDSDLIIKVTFGNFVYQ